MSARVAQIIITIITAALGITGTTVAQKIPKGFDVPESTFSRDGRYGVTVPILTEHDDSENPKNSVIELKTGRIVATIDAETGWNRHNHGGVLPSRWSLDNALLVWEVDGKWFPDALVVVCLENGKLKWQTNVLQRAQQEILARTKRTAPKKYAEARKANSGSGSAYPERFSIDVETLNPIALPLRVHVALTSNPKGLEDFPTLETSLDAIVDQQGKFIVTDFRMVPGRSRHF